MRKLKNKKMKKLILVLLIFATSYSYSQNEVDAFNYSQIYFEGTARSMAMGNALGALGADISTANTNPAGTGLFKHTEIIFSPSFSYNLSTVDFSGERTTAEKPVININNFSIINSFTTENKNLPIFNVSFGYNRYKNFNNSYNIDGINNKGSMLDFFMNRANGTPVDKLSNFSEYLAWSVYLLNVIDTNNFIYTNPLYTGGTPANFIPPYGQKQLRLKNDKGSAGELYLNAAINYKDILFVGTTIGLSAIYYSSKMTHTEEGFRGNPNLKYFTYKENLKDNGIGINAKIGVIVKPLKFLRIGAAYHTPTYLSIDDKYDTYIEARLVSPDSLYHNKSNTKNNIYAYHVTNPARYLGSIGIILGRFIALGAEYEYLDYSKMRLSAQSNSYKAENKAIKEIFKPVSNIKSGVEINLGIVKFRGGYAHFGNPYKKEKLTKYQYSGGIGFTAKNLYVDFAYVANFTNFKYYMYNGWVDDTGNPIEPIPEIRQKNNIFNITLGIKF